MNSIERSSEESAEFEEDEDEESGLGTGMSNENGVKEVLVGQNDSSQLMLLTNQEQVVSRPRTYRAAPEKEESKMLVLRKQDILRKQTAAHHLQNDSGNNDEQKLFEVGNE